jgi:hypothetical protein
MNYWTALDLIRQTAGELGLEQPTTLVDAENKQTIQLVSLMNAGGNELLNYYPWEQFITQWEWTTVSGKDAYDVPADWSYFTDQTQWDRTNHWPLLGPKSPQEWAWLKGGLLQAAPRMRYRVFGGKFYIHPIPSTTPFSIAMEYVRNTWVSRAGGADMASMVTADGDTVQFDPWLITRFIKMKFYELKAFETTGVVGDFMRIFNALTGKDKGAPKLSLSPRFPPLFIGPWSIPDGSWDVNPGMTP